MTSSSQNETFVHFAKAILHSYMLPAASDSISVPAACGHQVQVFWPSHDAELTQGMKPPTILPGLNSSFNKHLKTHYFSQVSILLDN